MPCDQVRLYEKVVVPVAPMISYLESLNYSVVQTEGDSIVARHNTLYGRVKYSAKDQGLTITGSAPDELLKPADEIVKDVIIHQFKELAKAKGWNVTQNGKQFIITSGTNRASSGFTVEFVNGKVVRITTGKFAAAEHARAEDFLAGAERFLGTPKRTPNRRVAQKARLTIKEQ